MVIKLSKSTSVLKVHDDRFLASPKAVKTSYFLLHGDGKYTRSLGSWLLLAELTGRKIPLESTCCGTDQGKHVRVQYMSSVH